MYVRKLRLEPKRTLEVNLKDELKETVKVDKVREVKEKEVKKSNTLDVFV